MLTLTELREHLNAALAAERNYQTASETLDQASAHYLQNPGKGLRPLLCLLVWQSHAPQSVLQGLPLAVAVELFHTFSLVHDDIMDQADTRRGVQAVHRAWNTPTAILAGDALFVRVFPKLVRVAPERAGHLVDLMAQAAMDVCVGQMLDMELEQSRQYQPDAYLEMIRMKTAVLIGFSMQLGALAAGAPQDEAARWRRYGEALGQAFQLQDDYLDLYAPPGADSGPGGFGKKRGGDILQDKLTLLWIHAWSQGDAQQRQVLEHWRGVPSPEAEKLAAVEAVFEATGVRQAMEQRMEELFLRAEQELAPLAHRPGVELIQHLAHQIRQRQT